MTDHPTDRPAHDHLPEIGPAFELASALHDGEGEDVERHASEEAVRAETRSVAAVARRVGQVPPAPAGLVDDHVAAAMAAFHEARPTAATDAPVTSLAGRRPWWQRLQLGAVAAVVAVVAVVGAIGLAAGGNDDDDTTATAAFDTGGDSGGDSGDPGERGHDTAEGAAPGAEAFDADGADDLDEGAAAGGTGLTGEERQAYDSYDELADALGREVSERTTTGSRAAPEESTAAAEPASGIPPGAAGDGGGRAGCDAAAAAGVGAAAVERVVPVVVEDRLVTAVVHASEDGRRLTSIDEATCTVADQRPL